MARYEMNIQGQRIQVQCHHCGFKDMFQHASNVFTCNRCGNTFETPAEGKLINETIIVVVEK